MSRDRGRRMSREDRVLWSSVARTITPLPGRALPEMPHADRLPEVPRSEEPTKPEARQREVGRPEPGAAAPAAFDRPTRRKLAKGRLAIESSIDLHGMTQSQAHSALLSFLHRAYHDDRRHVLVVTGKGASFGSDGILRRAVPAWLSTPAFRGLVSGYEDAARRHGGEGALYVRLRRWQEGPT